MRVAVIDSGIAVPGAAVLARRAFVLDEERDAVPDRVGHGTAVAQALLTAAPSAELLDAQIFLDSPVTTPAAVAAGLRWSVGQGARLAVMSFGLPAERAVLRDAVTEAIAAGVLLIAATPARGGPVWPAAFPGVIPGTGDARCAPGEVSVLPYGFGACPRRLDDPSDRPSAGGASLAVGHLAGILAASGLTDRDAAIAHLHRIARWHGRERKA